MIEHNLDVIKTADWLVDMGPEGGSGGGTLVAQGTPEQVVAVPESYTGQFLAPLLAGKEAKQPTRKLPAASAPEPRGRTAASASKRGERVESARKRGSSRAS